MSSRAVQEDREEVVLPPEPRRYYPGIPHRDNGDGTSTWFPNTTVTSCRGDYCHLHHYLSPKEIELLKSESQNKDEFKVSGPKKEFMLVSRRYLAGSADTAVAHLLIRHGGVRSLQSRPPRVNTCCSITLDICRGKSEKALKEILRASVKYFHAWATYKIEVFKMEHADAAHVAWNFTLRLPIVTETLNVNGWASPSLDQLKEWGYGELEKAQSDSNLKVLVLAKGMELQSNNEEPEEVVHQGNSLRSIQQVSPQHFKPRVKLVTNEFNKLHSNFQKRRSPCLLKKAITMALKTQRQRKELRYLLKAKLKDLSTLAIHFHCFTYR